MDKNTKETWPQDWALENTTSDQPQLDLASFTCCAVCAVWWHSGWDALRASSAPRSGWQACSYLNPLSGHSCRWVAKSDICTAVPKKPKRFIRVPRSGQRHSKVLAAQAHFTGVLRPWVALQKPICLSAVINNSSVLFRFSTHQRALPSEAAVPGSQCWHWKQITQMPISQLSERRWESQINWAVFLWCSLARSLTTTGLLPPGKPFCLSKALQENK